MGKFSTRGSKNFHFGAKKGNIPANRSFAAFRRGDRHLELVVAVWQWHQGRVSVVGFGEDCRGREFSILRRARCRWAGDDFVISTTFLCGFEMGL